jgi:hypothetical protein
MSEGNGQNRSKASVLDRIKSLTLNFAPDAIDTDLSMIDHHGEDDEHDGNEQLTLFLLKNHI